MPDRRKRIFDHFGIMTQIAKLGEEAQELADAITDSARGDGMITDAAFEHIISETADVNCIINQLTEASDKFKTAVEDEQKRKEIRTLARIEGGYYAN